MPTYTYSCPTHGEFEETHSIKTKLEFCPKCKEEFGIDVEIKRLISLNSPGRVDLSGQELVDKVKSEVKQLKRDAGKSEKTRANLVGEGKYESIQRNVDRAKRGW
jgi:putative FmdB family regulatory protein